MIPSLLQIPSAVSDSKLHSVLPNNGKGDFTFDRSTGATRINKDGLIEEVGYFSSELVQNGDFSELGNEELTNGDFSSASDWTITNNTGTETEIINGYVRIKTDGAYTQIRQFNVLSTGKTYKLVYDVIESDEGNLGLEIGGSTLLIPSTVGTHTFYWVSNASTFNIKRYGGALDIKIDNVSVKQVDPNDRWTLETGWSYGDNRLNFSGGSSNRACYSNIGITNGKTYKLSFNVLSISAGQVSLRFGGMAGVDEITATSTGIHSGIITANSSAIGTVQIEDNDNNFVGSITDVSVVEVQGDRPRLSYDITNGVVEDKPHLLLEPSSTNLVSFSEDFSQSVWNNFASITPIANSIISPEGLKNASTLACSGNNVFRYAFTASSSTNYVGSVFVKAKETTNDFGIQTLESGTAYKSVFNIESGVVVTQASNHTASIEDFGNGWFRCSVKFNSGSSTSNIFDFTGSQTSDIKEFYAWGAMLEQQSYATSYIPTAGTTITRAAETCNNSKPSVNSTEGVLYAEIASLTSDVSGDNRIVLAKSGDTNNVIRLYYNTTSNTIQYKVRVASSNVCDLTYDLGDSTAFHKICGKWKQNDFALWVDGVEVATDTSGAVFPADTLNTVNFSNANANGDIFYGKVKGLAVYNEALSESQLMQLTGVTASSIYSNFVTRTASFTVEALNEVKKVIDNL